MRANNEQERTVDAAIASAVASLRNVADRLEAGPRQRAAEVLMRGADAIEELSRLTERLLPATERSSRLRRMTSGRIPRSLAAVATLLVAAFAAYHWWPQHSPLRDVNGDGRVVVMCFGDSITAGNSIGVYPTWLQSDLGPLVKVVKEGRYGEKTETGKDRLRFALKSYHPDYVVVLEGINDSCEIRAKTVFNLSVMAAAIRDAGAIPLIGTVYAPAPSSEQDRACYDVLNKQIEAMIKKTPGTMIVDFAAAMDGNNEDLTVDGIHPNVAGVQVLAAVARGALIGASKGPEVTHASADRPKTPSPPS